MKKKMDIEKLLQWALLEEMPKGRPVSADIGYVIGRRHGVRPFNLSMRVGVLPDVDSLGFVPGAPHEDALIVADAIGLLETEARLHDPADAMMLFGEFAPICGDAMSSLMIKIWNPQSLVITHAISGKRPPWRFEQPVPYPVKEEFRDVAGSVRVRTTVYGTDEVGCTVMLAPNRGKRVQLRGMYDWDRTPRCPLNWNNPSVLAIGDARAEYLAWRDALAFLATALAGRLNEFEPLAPAAARLPWVKDDEPKSRVLSDGMPLGVMTAILPLRPKREAPCRPLSLHERARNARDKGISIELRLAP